jgi:hypothetical protein
LTERDANVAQARRSALLVAGGLAGLAYWQMHRHHLWPASVLSGAAIVTAAASISAAAAVWFQRHWMRLAEALGYVNSRVVLSIVYWAVLTPLGLATRAAGRDPLDRRKVRRTSYWVERQAPRQTREGFERAF